MVLGPTPNISDINSRNSEQLNFDISQEGNDRKHYENFTFTCELHFFFLDLQEPTQLPNTENIPFLQLPSTTEPDRIYYVDPYFNPIN